MYIYGYGYICGTCIFMYNIHTVPVNMYVNFCGGVGVDTVPINAVQVSNTKVYTGLFGAIS